MNHKLILLIVGVFLLWDIWLREILLNIIPDPTVWGLIGIGLIVYAYMHGEKLSLRRFR